MGRKRSDEGGVATADAPGGVEALTAAFDTQTVPVEGQAGPRPNGAATASTLPVGDKSEVPGEKPWVKLGPYPTGSRKTFLSVAIWKKEVTAGDSGELVDVFDVSITRLYHDAQGQPKNSKTLRSGELNLAILLLEKADRLIREHREHTKVPNGG